MTNKESHDILKCAEEVLFIHREIDAVINSIPPTARGNLPNQFQRAKAGLTSLINSLQNIAMGGGK